MPAATYLEGTHMARALIWMAYRDVQGWACSQCEWTYPLPSLLTDPQARDAFDRLASAAFKNHDCARHPKSAPAKPQEIFIKRMREFVSRGYKPKDAADLVVQEAMLEYRNEPATVQRARTEAEEFIRRVREGKI
jgi:hypothetical protein